MEEDHDLDACRALRENRKRRRNAYIQKLTVLKQRIRESSDSLQKYSQFFIENKNQQKPTLFRQQHPQISSKLELKEEVEEVALQQKNSDLKNQLLKIQKLQQQKLTNFKNRVQKVRVLYINKIRQIAEQGRKYKEGFTKQIKKLTEQITVISKKSQEVEQMNIQIQNKIKKAQKIGQQYENQLREEYSSKLKGFSQIYSKSSEKIREFESKVNNDGIVESALSSSDEIKSIKEYTEKAAENLDLLYSHYTELLASKSQILKQMKSEIELKEKEVGNIKVQEEKLSSEIKKLNEKKEIYLKQNTKLSAKVMKIGNRGMKINGQL